LDKKLSTGFREIGVFYREIGVNLP